MGSLVVFIMLNVRMANFFFNFIFQGFEVVLNGRKYFAFSNYTVDGKQVTSYCDQTLTGWSHDIYVRDWACYQASKTTAVQPKKYHISEPS